MDQSELGNLWAGIGTLKSGSHLPKNCFICFNGNVEKCFLKALSILKIFKCLFWLFGHVEKTAWLERSG